MKPEMKRFAKNWIGPMVLLMYSLVGINQGADMTDTTYSLGNYLFFDSMEGSWKYATFLANWLGKQLLWLSGNSFLIMNGLTGLLVGITAVTAYFYLKKELPAVAVFCGEVLALSLCWCPTVILYNYLTYFFLTLGVVFLLKALKNNQKRDYVIAGVFLGVNVLVRISNAVEVLLILLVWYACRKKKDEKETETKKTLWKSTGLCVLGFFIGLLAAVLLMLLTSDSEGFVGMLQWILSLFTASEDAGGYSFGVMLSTILDNYFGNLKWFGMMAAGTLLGIGGFSLWKGKFLWLKKIGYVACVALLFVYFFRNGVFTAGYYNVGSIYCLSVMFFLLCFVVFGYAIWRKEVSAEKKNLAFAGLLLLLITPIGSNNHLYTCINNLFLPAPICFSLVGDIWKKYGKRERLFPLKAMATCFFLVFALQSMLFHFCFVFHDGTEGEKRDTTLQAESFMEGMRTNSEHAASLDELVRFMENGDGRKVILYGNIPGVSYLLNRQTAVSTAWPDLESYALEDWRNELAEPAEEELPYVILSAERLERTEGLTTENEEAEELKFAALCEFMQDYQYEIIFENKEFVICCSD